MPDKIMTEADYARLKANLDSATANTMTSWWSTLATAETTPMPPPAPRPGGWSTGVWAEHSASHAVEWFRWLGYDMAPVIAGQMRDKIHVTMFVTHNKDESAMLNPWWQREVPEGMGLSLRVPLVPKGDPNLKTDRTTAWRRIAQQAAQIDPYALICPGWEMNLPQWAHKVTAANLVDWRAAWTRCYDTMKAECPTLTIGFNPNGGGDQTGVDVRRAIVVGKVDAIGPDQYDCWPGFTSGTNDLLMLDRVGGLRWWRDIADDHGVPFILPEWGVSSGSQWAGHTGADNSNAILNVRAFCEETAARGDMMQGSGLFMESYFNGSYKELRGDIWRPAGLAPSNPKAGALYRSLWRAR